MTRRLHKGSASRERSLDGRAHAAGPRPARPRLEPESRRGRARPRGTPCATRSAGPASSRAARAFQIGVTTSRRARPRRSRRGIVGRRPRGVRAGAVHLHRSRMQIAALPAGGTVLVYLDVFEEHVQPAEDPSELVDPALGPIDTTGAHPRRLPRPRRADHRDDLRSRLGGARDVAESTGQLTIARAGSTGTTDPCAPPGDPLAQIADGLFRVEVLDGGTEATARFAWSYEDGASAVADRQAARRARRSARAVEPALRRRRPGRGLLARAARRPRRPRRALPVDDRHARGGRRHADARHAR